MDLITAQESRAMTLPSHLPLDTLTLLELQLRRETSEFQLRRDTRDKMKVKAEPANPHLDPQLQLLGTHRHPFSHIDLDAHKVARSHARGQVHTIPCKHTHSKRTLKRSQIVLMEKYIGCVILGEVVKSCRLLCSGKRKRSCHGMEFLCASYGRPQCLSESRVCDGRRDCDDGSDEHLCGRLIPDPGNFNEYEPIRRKGFIQMKREGKWRNVCFEKFTSGGYRILIVMLKDLCKDIAGEKRCGRETVLLKNIESSYINRNQNFDSSIFVKLEFAGGSLAGSCRSSLVGYLECGQPCPQQHRNRRDASDALEAPSSANISPRTAPLQPNPTAPQQQDAGQEEDAHWEQMSQRLLQQEKEQGQMDSRIVGGDSANRKEWPFIVSMNYRGEHFCGGSIITAEWVLTAAHCLFSIKGSLHKIVIEVQAGMLRRLSWSPYEQTSTVSHALFHPEYNQYSSDNDIMLIKLTTPFHLNRWVQTVDLAQSGEVSQKMCSVAGWGVTMENGNLPNELQTVDVPLHDKCPKSYRVPDSNFLCAGYQQGGMDSCQGDSGGPMMCKSKNKAWELYGVVSFGIGCARRGYPGAYTKVPTYYNWIMRSMSGTSHMVAARKTCENKCWRKIGSCLHSSRCRERNDCWDVQKRCNRGLNISTADLQFHRSSLPLSPPVKIQFTKPCPEGMASCVTSDECYFPNQRCDREINCNDLSDEMNCTCLMHTATEYLCDGYPDCPDFSDELKCAAQDKGCSEGGMWCTPAGTCVNKDKLCDGIQDCEDNSDEHLCMRLVSDPHDSSDTFIIKGKGFLQVRAMEQWLPFCPTRDQSHAALVASVCTDIVGHRYGIPIVMCNS
ncbi:serine protease nudel-like [Penaeus japonicus]|uniref:serine protease nudel-like n=1 Tax=Penaeus japonicus TaxID=27405 RepID=UPI001C713E24|nr:serine protease nudel-like [Penaeus japonicus]